MDTKLELPQLSSGDVNIFFIQPCDISEERLAQCMEWLNQEEIARSERFYFDKDRREYLLGKVLMRFVLSHYRGISPKKLVFKKNDYGKPFLKNAAGLEFNLSHSAGANVLAVSVDRAVGIDIERLDQHRCNLSIIDSFCSPTELSKFSDLNYDNAINHFFSLWTLKESFVKAVGKGLFFPLADVSFDLVEGRIHISITRTLSREHEYWSSKTIIFSNAYICSSMILSSIAGTLNQKYYSIVPNEKCFSLTPPPCYQGGGKVDGIALE